jgi:S-(hydroxymethyl)glutathione dehydrogenase/alcohol dehydrogenase
VSAQGRTVEAPVLRRARVPMVLEEITVLPPREGEVLVRLVASGVCHSCLHSFDGSLSDARMPAVLGDEGAGIPRRGTGHYRAATRGLSWRALCHEGALRGSWVTGPPGRRRGEGESRYPLPSPAIAVRSASAVVRDW